MLVPKSTMLLLMFGGGAEPRPVIDDTHTFKGPIETG
jgi:hypothetical protein